MKPKVLFVTDPMCSWCWGMSSEMTRAMALLVEEFEFDLVLGGINVDSTQHVNEFGRARLADVWRRVTEVTGTTFGPGLPTGDFVYNSTRACVAVEVVRELTGRTPFEYLQRLQDRFFLGAEDVTKPALLIAEAAALGLDAKRFETLLRSPDMLLRVREGFAAAKSHGTAALPSVLLEVAGVRRLVSGGYIDAPTLVDSLHAFL
jgi:putative protein-disulfide isomerase